MNRLGRGLSWGRESRLEGFLDNLDDEWMFWDDIAREHEDQSQSQTDQDDIDGSLDEAMNLYADR